MNERLPHQRVLQRSDDCYVADIPDLKFCSALGDSPEVALREVLIAKEAWLQAAKRVKKPIPKPKYRPAVYQIH